MRTANSWWGGPRSVLSQKAGSLRALTWTGPQCALRSVLCALCSVLCERLRILGKLMGIQGPGLGVSMGAGSHCVMRLSIRARCWRDKLQRFQSHLKKCSVSGTDSSCVYWVGISSEFWIHTAQTIGSCALYYTKVTSISFEKVRCLWVSIYRFRFRESNDRKTNCSVSTGVLSLTLRFVSVCSLFPLLSVLYRWPLFLFFLYYCFSYF